MAPQRLSPTNFFPYWMWIVKKVKGFENSSEVLNFDDWKRRIQLNDIENRQKEMKQMLEDNLPILDLEIGVHFCGF